MECNCGFPVRQSVYRDGRACYTCPYGCCRFFGFSPVQCEGYHRILITNKMDPATTIATFEALLHPDTQEPSVMATLWTANDVAGRATNDAARAVLERECYRPSFYVPYKAYLYALEQYQPLVTALRLVAHVLVQEIPTFFFRSWTLTRQLPAQMAAAVSAGTEAAVDPSDHVYTQLKSFQRKGVEFVVAHGGRGMIADDMGLGKTIQAIAIAHHYRSEWPVLVVCPMSLIENWAKEFNRFCGIPFSRIAILQGTKAKPESVHDVVIVSYSSLKCVEKESYRVVILDESHYIKAGDTRRTQLALRKCHAARRVVLLSGTPAMSRPMELYTQLCAVHPHLVPTKTQYAARYCNGHVGRFGMDYHGHSHIGELHFMLAHFLIRRTKRELSEAELPSKTRQLLYVYITTKEKKALERQVVALRTSLMGKTPSGCGLGGGATESGANATGTGGELTVRAPNAFELKIATARAKIPAVKDYVASIVEQHVESGQKIIFFAHHQCMMEAIKAAIDEVRPSHPIDYIYITGETPAAQREHLATHFRSAATCTAAVLSMGSSGTGHNFTCASTVVFAELDWNPSTHLQCEDRVHRIGQESPCTIKYLLADGTSDDVIWPMLQAKLTVTSAVLEHTTAQRLADNAAQQRVSRRDVAEASASGERNGGGVPTQGTLEGFLKSSASSQVTRSASASAGFAHVHATPLSMSITTVVDADEDVTDVPEGNASSSDGVAPLPPVRLLPSAIETLPTPPASLDETQPPASPTKVSPESTVNAAAVSHTAADTPTAALKIVHGPPPSVPRTLAVITIAELHCLPHLLIQGPRHGGGGGGRGSASHRTHGPSASAANASGSSPVLSRGSQGGGGGGSTSTARESQPTPSAGASILDMMRRSQQQVAVADGDVVAVDHVGGSETRPTVPPPPSVSQSTTPLSLQPQPRRMMFGEAAVRAVSQALLPVAPAALSPTAISLPAAHACTSRAVAPLPCRRTTFRLQSVGTAAPAVAPSLASTGAAPAVPAGGVVPALTATVAVSALAPATVPPRGTAVATPPPPTIVNGPPTPLVRVPVRVDLRKRPRSSSGGSSARGSGCVAAEGRAGAGDGASSLRASVTAASTPNDATHSPPASLSERSDGQPPLAARRTTFCFRGASSSASGTATTN